MPKPITAEEGLILIKKTIKDNIKHRDYDRTVEIADKYKAYITGEDIDKLLRQFVPRENDELFTQRKLITSLTTPDIANTLASPMYKVGRTTAAKSITWKDDKDSETKIKKLSEVTDKFCGESSIDKYLATRMVELDMQDPNAWIVVEFEEAVDPKKPNIKANPYPFEVYSKNAINFSFVNKIAQWLMVLNDNEDRYTLYLPNESITADKIPDDQIQAVKAELKGNQDIFYKDEKNKDKDAWLININEHKAGRLPARRVGFNEDPETDNRTFVPLIHSAECYFKKAIKTVSEFDLTTALHAFPKVFRYGNACEGDMANGIICNDGKTAEGKHCPVCKGTGWSNQTTTASEVVVKAPKEIKDLVSLDLMMAYKSPPAELIEFQKKYGLYDLKELSLKAVYTGDTFSKNTVAQTATEITFDFESINDTLSPFADNWSNMYVHLTTLSGIYIDLGKDINIKHTFPKNFKMESLQQLFAILKAANDAYAPVYVKTAISMDIAKKVYIDDHDQILKIMVKERFFPFNGKSENEINYILSNSLASTFDKILYAKFDNIFIEVEQEQPESVNFYKMEFKKQKELISKKVNEYIAVIDNESANSRAVAFSAAGAAVGEGGGV